MIRSTVGVAIAALLAACSPSEPAPSASPGGPAVTGMGGATMADLKVALPVKELMGHVIDYNAFGVWNHQGWLINKDGTHELFPTDEAGWVATESAAISLAEASNLLLLPGRPPDDDRRWVDNAHMLYDAAMKTQASAQRAGELLKAGKMDEYAKEKQVFFDAGGEIYDACVTCHAHYVQGDEAGPVAKLPTLPNRVPPPNQ
ncbi:MAG TPA: hypothetical protein VFV70_11925 [Hyphomonadaceae bacterium]|nr:hypothetical protein [Hyphomonadaceae bacterium]